MAQFPLNNSNQSSTRSLNSSRQKTVAATLRFFISMRITVFKSLKEVFRAPRYVVISCAVALLLWAFAVWLTQYKMLVVIMGSDAFTILEKLRIFVNSFGSFRTQFTGVEQIIVVVSSIIAGIDVSVAWYYIMRRVNVARTVGVSGIGFFSILLGIGCSACGSILISTFIGLGATATLIRALPFRGFEFNILGLALLLWSLISLTNQIAKPEVCTPNKK